MHLSFPSLLITFMGYKNDSHVIPEAKINQLILVSLVFI